MVATAPRERVFVVVVVLALVVVVVLVFGVLALVVVVVLGTLAAAALLEVVLATAAPVVADATLVVSLDCAPKATQPPTAATTAAAETAALVLATSCWRRAVLFGFIIYLAIIAGRLPGRNYRFNDAMIAARSSEIVKGPCGDCEISNEAEKRKDLT